MARALMRVLVTRPQDDAAEFAAKLKEHGHEAVLAPLLEIRFRDGPDILLDGVQAILATSANGVRAIARRTARRDIAVFAVGPQTAATAREAGFTDIRSADGDGKTLAQAVQGWTTPDRGMLFHAAGAEAPKLLATSLRQSGFDVRSEALYEAMAAHQLPSVAANALRAGRLDAVVHFSPRSARIFAECVARAGLAESSRGLIAICISQAVAEALSPLTFREIRVAAEPNQTELLRMLG